MNFTSALYNDDKGVIYIIDDDNNYELMNMIRFHMISIWIYDDNFNIWFENKNINMIR